MADADRLAWRAFGMGMLLLGGCGPPGEQPAASSVASMDVVEPGLVLGPPGRVRSEWMANDTFALFRATDLALLPDGLLVGDSGNDRLVVFDWLLQPQKTIGRSGAGPGELRQPFRIRARDGLLVASELGNPRFSVFLEDGTFSHVVPRHGIEGVFDFTSDGVLFRGSDYDGHYLLRVEPGGDTSSVAAIPVEVRSLRRPGRPVPRWRSDFVAVTASDTVHVFDNETGVLAKVDRQGRVRAVRALPAALREAILERSERESRSLVEAGYSILGATIAKHLSVTSAGDLYLSLARDRIIGLLIDPHTYATRYVRVPRDTNEWEAAAKAMAVVIRDSIMYTLYPEGLASFPIREDIP